MGKKILILGLGIVLWGSAAFAEIIHLKNGRKIRGKIIENNAQQIKVDVGGVKITYYPDEIDRIEEEGISSGKVDPSAVPAGPAMLPPQGQEEKNHLRLGPKRVQKPHESKGSRSQSTNADDFCQ